VYLKKVEISGFKSFANKTVLDFSPSLDPGMSATRTITAIVGPNGSGKSNVADAIRWAIGEQSAKNLRGKKSEDVIFAGTDAKARMGSATVTLHFDNSDKRIPIEFGEVSITRRVFRSGESEYLINGSKVRLLDIIDLLAKAGIGKDSYSVITQGMSDATLQATPVERRSIFEDAAGVKQYQIEKERSQRKLLNTEENLTRVEALIQEIEPHLKGLKRQAEKASQGKDISLKLHEKQVLLYGYLWKQFEKERSTVLVERDVLQKDVFELEVSTNTLSGEMTKLREELEGVQEETELIKTLDELRAEQNDIERKQSVLKGKIEIERERQKEEEVIRTIPVDLPYVQKALAEIRTGQEALVKSISECQSLDQLKELKKQAEDIQEKLAQLNQKASSGSIKEVQVIRLPVAEKEASDARIKESEDELKRMSSRYETVKLTVKELEERIASSRDATKAKRDAFFIKEKAWRETEMILARKKDALNDIKVRLARVEVREEDLTKLVQEELSVAPTTLTYDESIPVERERLEREIARLKVEVEHIGSIDPEVVHEYEETQERFDFLTRESSDLRQAMESLSTVIDEMDHKVDVAFKKAFHDIREKFAENFKIIFGGGKAELSLVAVQKRKKNVDAELEGEVVDEEAILEESQTGIEISACPPGKKITNLSMLSGGERSLTSLALLFAIISYNPPPFAVLDEVEAALDEANSRRFGKMLGELSKHTQFIAITHNRETMSHASLLYGVTMGADGISQLLSVHLDDIEKKLLKA
jgi:chromosome segregation ATPase